MEIFYQLHMLSQNCNMQYTCITVDVGAAMKAFQVIWNNSILWSHISLHFGNFHCILMFVFLVIGSYLKGSGFEEIIFQVKLCTSGCIIGIMKGKY